MVIMCMPHCSAPTRRVGYVYAWSNNVSKAIVQHFVVKIRVSIIINKGFYSVKACYKRWQLLAAVIAYHYAPTGIVVVAYTTHLTVLATYHQSMRT